jgi:hypothetical protein
MLNSTIMKPLAFKQMEQTQGGISWFCALAIAAAVVTEVGTAGGATLANIALLTVACA